MADSPWVGLQACLTLYATCYQDDTEGDLVFNIEPDREPDRSPRRPSSFRAPLSQPPAPPTSWWKSIPGQLALVVILGGGFVILLGLLGIIGPLSQR